MSIKLLQVLAEQGPCEVNPDRQIARVAPNLTFSNLAEAEFDRISELKFGRSRSRIWLKLVFWSQNKYTSDKTNGVNNAVSRYRGSTLQCFLC